MQLKRQTPTRFTRECLPRCSMHRFFRSALTQRLALPKIPLPAEPPGDNGCPLSFTRKRPGALTLDRRDGSDPPHRYVSASQRRTHAVNRRPRMCWGRNPMTSSGPWRKGDPRDGCGISGSRPRIAPRLQGALPTSRYRVVIVWKGQCDDHPEDAMRKSMPCKVGLACPTLHAINYSMFFAPNGSPSAHKI